MGFFNNINEGAIYLGSDYESLISDSKVKPSSEYLEFDEASLVAVAESEENYNSLIKYIGITEASYYAKTGKEMVYTESVFGSIFSKIKAFLKKVWEKIKALFKRFIMLFDKYSKDDKSFIKKYEKAVRRASGEEIEFKGYPFSSAKLLKTSSISVTKAGSFTVAGKTIAEWFTNSNAFGTWAFKNKTEIDKFREDPEETYDKLRGVLLGGSGSISSSEFASELFEATHGSAKKEPLDGTDISAETALSIISDTKNSTKEAKKVYEATDKLINKVWIKSIERVEKNALAGKDSTMGGAGKDDKVTDGTDYNDTALTDEEKSGDPIPGSNSKEAKKNAATHAASALLSFLHTASSLVTQVNGALLTAYKDRNRQARAICAKYIVKGKTQGAIGESASYSGSFLSDIQFK